MDTVKQLTLNLKLRSEYTLYNFQGNQPIIYELNESLHKVAHSFTYVWGEKYSGRSHLAHAYCHLAEQKKLSWMYLPLTEIVNYSPDIFEGLENYAVLVCDDLEMLAGKNAWEESFFHLYNRGLQTQQHLLVTANCAPAQLEITLADLSSRLKSAVIFKLNNLNETEKLMALAIRAQEKGWQLPAEVGEFLLRRWPRDLVALFAALETLDQASLQQQRRITIPFVKEILQL